ncbi:hypothetical protein DFH28DRAFT_1119537 [Melampsora americana]|nr:hypothetical protein DFH28DRAFT_1119537 [Melampsora americana]
MSYFSPRFITLACIITMLFGGYNGIPCDKVEIDEGRQMISEVPLTASPSGLSDNQKFSPPQGSRPVPGGLARRMLGAGVGPKKEPPKPAN